MSSNELLKLLEHLPLDDFEKKVVASIVDGDDPERVLEILLNINEGPK